MKKIDAIIFDLDGTLWNTVDSCHKAISLVKEEHNDITRDVTREQIESAMGKTSDEIINIYYGYLPREKGKSMLMRLLIRMWKTC